MRRLILRKKVNNEGYCHTFCYFCYWLLDYMAFDVDTSNWSGVVRMIAQYLAPVMVGGMFALNPELMALFKKEGE